MVLVLFQHTSEYMGYKSSYGAAQAALTFLRMPMLMLISGALVADYVPEKLYSRARRLAWITLCWTPLLTLAHSIGNISAAQPWYFEFINPNTEIWYLWALALLLVIDPLLHGVPPLAVLAVAFIVKMSSIRGWVPHEFHGYGIIGWSQLMSYGVFFYAGKYASQTVRDLVSNQRVSTPIMLGGLCIGFSALDVPTFTSLTFAAAFLATCPLLLRYVPFTAVGAAIGRRTLPIYLGHALLLRPFSPFLWHMHGVEALLVAALLLPASLLLKWAADGVGLRFLYKEPDWQAMSAKRLAVGGRAGAFHVFSHRQ